MTYMKNKIPNKSPIYEIVNFIFNESIFFDSVFFKEYLQQKFSI